MKKRNNIVKLNKFSKKHKIREFVDMVIDEFKDDWQHIVNVFVGVMSTICLVLLAITTILLRGFMLMV